MKNLALASVDEVPLLCLESGDCVPAWTFPASKSVPPFATGCDDDDVVPPAKNLAIILLSGEGVLVGGVD